MTSPSVIVMLVLIAVFGVGLATWAVIEATRSERLKRQAIRHDRHRR